jgi:hypothetical protein
VPGRCIEGGEIRVVVGVDIELVVGEEEEGVISWLPGSFMDSSMLPIETADVGSLRISSASVKADW